jgi:hypothetical protein
MDAIDTHLLTTTSYVLVGRIGRTGPANSQRG